jgi:chemotaxis protein MotB
MMRFLFSPRRALVSAVLLLAVLATTTGCNPIRALKMDIELKEARISQLEQEKERHDAELRQYSEQTVAATMEADRLKKENEQFTLQVAAANRLLGDARTSQAESMAREMEERLARENELRLRVEQLESESEIRSNSLALAESDLQSANTAMEGLRTRINEMTSTLELKTAEGRTLMAERDDARAERDDFRRQLTALSTDKEEAATQVEKLSSDLRDREKELAAATRALEEAKAELATQAQAVAAVAATRTDLVTRVADALRPSLDAGIAKVEERNGEIHVSILNEALYQPGTVLLSANGEQMLNSLARALRGIAVRHISVEGHTDNVPLTNMPYQDNWDLGAARALAVTRFLAYGDEVPARLLSASSRAFFSPVAPNDTPENRRLNRRVELVIVPGE